MAGPGHVTTARGDSLNFDDLVAKSKRPIGLKEEKSTIKKKPDPSRRKQLNVRGFRPAQGESKLPEATAVPEQVAEQKAPISAYNDGKEADSLADVTGIKVKKKATTKKPDKPAVEAASDALGDILGDIEASNPNSVAAADEVEKEEVKKTTRRRTRSTK